MGPGRGLQEAHHSLHRCPDEPTSGAPPTHHSSLKRCRRQRSPREKERERERDRDRGRETERQSTLGTELGRWYSEQRTQSSTIPRKVPRCLHENVNSSGAIGPGHCPVPCLPLSLSSSHLFILHWFPCGPLQTFGLVDPAQCSRETYGQPDAKSGVQGSEGYGLPSCPPMPAPALQSGSFLPST